MAVEAVSCELVSTSQFPVSRQFTGKSQKALLRARSPIASIWRSFPAHQAAIPWEREQGNPSDETGRRVALNSERETVRSAKDASGSFRPISAISEVAWAASFFSRLTYGCG
jgi:hypothetical protein